MQSDAYLAKIKAMTPQQRAEEYVSFLLFFTAFIGKRSRSPFRVIKGDDFRL